jgi:hypothetical protein
MGISPTAPKRSIANADEIQDPILVFQSAILLADCALAPP